MMRRLFSLLLLLCMALVIPAQAQDSDIFTSPWGAEYFNNPYLAGAPIVTQQDDGIGFDWALEAPVDGVPEDNFSARWSKAGVMPAGTYRFVLTASLGFRLYIDNEMILDTWDGSAEGTTIGRDIFIEGGYHNIQLDYRAFSGNAFIFLDWGLAPNGALAPQSTASIDVNTVTVIANTLNVRSEPRIANNITTRLTRGQQFIQINASDDGRWLEIDLGNGATGWVNATYMNAEIGTTSTEGLTGQMLRSTARLFVRSDPAIDSEALGLLLRGEDATIIGRSADGNWWQINDNGRIGWVNALFVVLSPDVDADAIVITDES